jgi:organic radical activating enzyme
MSGNFLKWLVQTLKQSKIYGNISEVFASIQGEGLYIGTMQLFIRLAGCTLGCKRCELKDYQQSPESFSIRPWPGLRNHRALNPVSAEKLLSRLDNFFELKDFYCISILGGEPLQQMDFLEEFLPMLRKRGLKVFTETSGLLPDEFVRLYPLIDYWCVDLKISRAWGFNGKLRRKLEKILSVAGPDKTYFRILLDSNDDSEAILKQIEDLDFSAFNCIIQPFAYAPSHVNDWDTNTILEWIKLFKPCFREVRWIPQVHKLLRII